MPQARNTTTAEHKTRNGGDFPVDDLETALPELRRPFTAEAVRFKLQTGTMAVAYIDSRLVAERLDLVCPHFWHDEFEAAVMTSHVVCKLTVGGSTRCDVGKASQGDDATKGMYSDAFKRAAVKFGIGRYLYSLPKFWVKEDEIRYGKNGKAVGLLPATEKKLRDEYRKWLNARGKQMFGAPLEHGDAPDSVGDYEDGTETREVAVQKLSAGQKKNMEARINEYLDTSAEDDEVVFDRLAEKLAELGAELGEDDDDRGPAEIACELPYPDAKQLFNWLFEQLTAAREQAAEAAKTAETSGDDTGSEEGEDGEEPQLVKVEIAQRPYSPDQE